MTWTEYTRLRQASYAALLRARDEGAAAVKSGDTRRMVEACKANDAAYLADERVLNLLLRGEVQISDE